MAKQKVILVYEVVLLVLDKGQEEGRMEEQSWIWEVCEQLCTANFWEAS